MTFAFKNMNYEKTNLYQICKNKLSAYIVKASIVTLQHLRTAHLQTLLLFHKGHLVTLATSKYYTVEFQSGLHWHKCQKSVLLHRQSDGSLCAFLPSTACHRAQFGLVRGGKSEKSKHSHRTKEVVSGQMAALQPWTQYRPLDRADRPVPSPKGLKENTGEKDLLFQTFNYPTVCCCLWMVISALPSPPKSTLNP